VSPRRPASVHWLRENQQERSPRRVLIVDTETTPASVDNPDQHHLRLWCARLVRRRGVDPRKPRHEDYAGLTADELADLVTSLARADHTLWLLTHNLNFDLAVTALPVLLTERGWRITEGALTTDDPWCRLARGSRRLAIADSWSYLPQSLEAIGKLIGLRKLQLPDWRDDDAAWLARCRRDVEITARAVMQLLDWWDAGHYGNWSITGPSTGWSSYRHRRPAPRVLVDPDPEARALEARAVTGGRRGVRWIGRQPVGLYADLDLTTAHLVAMSERLLPMRRLRSFASLGLDHHALRSNVLDVLAECEVEVAAPRYPWDSGHGIFYPVGRFRTVLAGPEVRDALARGELRSIGAGYSYVLGNHMQGWARWLATLLDDTNRDVPPAARLAAKHWSRCVPGKWAGHRSEVIRRVPDPRPGWQVERGFLAAEGRPADFLRIGGELWTIARDEWADDAFPAILAWIQSWTRLAVNRLGDRLGSAALTVNTDGLVVNVDQVRDGDGAPLGQLRTSALGKLRALDGLCQAWAPLVAPFQVRIKGAANQVTVISPQHLILDGEKRLAGIPHRATVLADGQYRFTQWPRLRVQLQREAPPGYRTVRRTVNLANVAPTGWLLDTGEVLPPLVWQQDGADVVAPPHWTALGHGDALAPPERQHPVLRRAMAGWPSPDYGLDAPGAPVRPAGAEAVA
jgi:hypothetical protein